MAEEEKSMTNISTDITIAVVVLLILLALVGAYLDRILDWIYGILGWVLTRNWNLLRLLLIILFGILDIVLLGFIIRTMRKHAELDQLLPHEPPPNVHIVSPKEVVNSNWKEIRNLANSENPSDWNMAMIRADGLLNETLHNLGYEGDTMADRLKIVDPTRLISLDRIWSAHRLRNNIVHGPPQNYPRETIIQALQSYEQGLRELGMM
jgi:hypothetical protein